MTEKGQQNLNRWSIGTGLGIVLWVLFITVIAEYLPHWPPAIVNISFVAGGVSGLAMAWAILCNRDEL